jgi:hypothetical protein
MTDLTGNLDLFYKFGEFVVLGAGVVVAILRTGRIIQKFEGIAERQTAEITDLKTDVKQLSQLIIEMTKLSGRLDLMDQRQVAEGKRVDDLQLDIRQILKFMPRLDNSNH